MDWGLAVGNLGLSVAPPLVAFWNQTSFRREEQGLAKPFPILDDAVHMAYPCMSLRVGLFLSTPYRTLNVSVSNFTSQEGKGETKH